MTTTAASDAVSFNVFGVSVYGDHITVRIGSASGLHEKAVHETTGSGTPPGAYIVTPSVPATTAVVLLSPVPHKPTTFLIQLFFAHTDVRWAKYWPQRLFLHPVLENTQQ